MRLRWPGYARRIADGEARTGAPAAERTAAAQALRVDQVDRARAPRRRRRVRAHLAGDAEALALARWATVAVQRGVEVQGEPMRLVGGLAGLVLTARVRHGRRTWEAECELEGPVR